MRFVYLSFSAAIILLGLVHIASTPRHLTTSALWFASGGLAIVLTGALNLLNRSYGEIALGLRLVCVGANIVMSGFSVLTGYVTRASTAQFVLVIGLLAGTTILSLLPAARLRNIDL